jgi:WXG100 family type VII secretion target
MADFRFEQDEVDAIQRRLAQQVENINNLLSTIDQGVQLVEGGAWVGVGSRAFQNEYNGQLVTNFQVLMGTLETFRANLVQAAAVIEDANQVVRQKAADAVWTYNIF